MAHLLPGIIRVGYLPCSSLLPDIQLKARAGVPVSVLTDVNWLEIQSDASCQSVVSYENHGELESASLQFHTTSDIPTRLRLAFVMEDATQSMWLIGAAEPPYPTVEITRNTGSMCGERAGNTVKVSLMSIKSLIPISK